MRVYFTCFVRDARKILASGFSDCYEFGGQRGVWVGSRPLDANDGFSGDVVLAADVPDDLFAQHEMLDCPADAPEFRTGRALIPAEQLNRHGSARIYDHTYFVDSRRGLVQATRKLEKYAESIDEILGADELRSIREQIEELRDAMAFFDEIGWLTPLKAQEQEA